jgi:hypothetical protein
MRIRCIASVPTADQLAQLKSAYDPERSDYDLDLLREYVALGVGYWDGIAWAEIATDGGWLLSVPLFLFEVTDARASRYWEIRYETNSMRLWPSSFYKPTFNSELADDIPEAVEQFQKVRRLIEAEALNK